MKDPDYEDTAKPNREKLFRVPWRVLLSSVLGMAVPVQEVQHEKGKNGSGKNAEYFNVPIEYFREQRRWDRVKKKKTKKPTLNDIRKKYGLKAIPGGDVAITKVQCGSSGGQDCLNR